MWLQFAISIAGAIILYPLGLALGFMNTPPPASSSGALNVAVMQFIFGPIMILGLGWLITVFAFYIQRDMASRFAAWTNIAAGFFVALLGVAVLSA